MFTSIVFCSPNWLLPCWYHIYLYRIIIQDSKTPLHECCFAKERERAPCCAILTPLTTQLLFNRWKKICSVPLQNRFTFVFVIIMCYKDSNIVNNTYSLWLYYSMSLLKDCAMLTSFNYTTIQWTTLAFFRWGYVTPPPKRPKISKDGGADPPKWQKVWNFEKV